MTDTIDDIVTHPTLYKRGVKGEVRVWSMQLFGDQHRVQSGILDGALTPSGWTTCEPKNVGKKNATTAEWQAYKEVKALYDIKRERGYFDDITQIDNVAFTKPMLAVDIDKRRGKFKIHEGVYAQPKLDGIRCIARVDGLWTRTGKPINSVPHIVAELAPLFARDPDLILDGELYNHALRDDFNTITSIVRKQKPSEDEIEYAQQNIEYHIYDVPSHPEKFSERLAELRILFEYMMRANQPGGDLRPVGSLHPVKTELVFEDEVLTLLFQNWIEEGYEGQMVRLNEVYQFKRSNALMKRKDFITEEFKVLAMEEGNGNWAGCIKRFIIDLPLTGKTCEATPRGTQEALGKLLQDGNTPDWATVRHFGYTPDGKLRFPIAVDYGCGKRDD